MNNNYLLEGADSFAIDLRIKQLIEKHQFIDSSINIYDLEEVPFSLALKDLDTYGLFSEKKVIIIKHMEVFNPEVAEKEFEHFLEYLKQPIDERLLIVVATKLNNTKKITKTLKKQLTYSLVSIDAIAFAKQELHDYQVEPFVIKKIVMSCLEDIGRIHQECEKLKMLCAEDKIISLKDVEENVLKKLGDSTGLTFDFVRVLAARDKKKSLEKYQELLEYQIEPLALIGLLASQFRIMYQVKILQEQGLSTERIATTLGEKTYRISKTRELTRYYSDAELLLIMRKLGDMDLKLKSSTLDGKFLIELFILNI